MAITKLNLLFFLKMILILGLLLPCTTCKNNKKNLIGGISHLSNTQNSDNLVEKNSILFERNKDLTSAKLSFKTKIKLKCKIQISTTHTENHPLIQDCKSNEGDKNFSEILKDLPPNEDVKIKVLLFPSDLIPVHPRYFEIIENGDRANTMLDKIIVGRINLPQSSGELYQSSFTKKQALRSVIANYKSEIGCKESKIPLSNPFPKDEMNISISNINSSGFASTTAQSHPNYPGRFILNFNLIQVNQEWSWDFTTNSVGYQLITKPPGFLSSIFLFANEQKIQLKNKALVQSETVDLSSISPPFKFKFEWEPNNLTVGTSFVYIQLIGKENKKLIACVFNASDKTASLPDNYLSTLANGEYTLNFILQTTQVNQSKEGLFPAWLISTQDWRQAKLIL